MRDKYLRHATSGRESLSSEFLLYTITDKAGELPTEKLKERLDELTAGRERTVTEMKLAKRALIDLETE